MFEGLEDTLEGRYGAGGFVNIWYFRESGPMSLGEWIGEISVE